ncbi:AAA family ATPase [Portibacter marinus]|uniref:AAA family ATPase n=1 Tax=Portibacter marinus TaxID=2898660 RepID=UPI001F216844|nr:ATP-binding protein [Portibacter marinus]
MKKIIITGPESSGKTTLAKDLARHYQVDFVKEYARKYLKEKWTNYDFEDVINIAEGQNKRERKATKNAEKLVICDTDLLTIKIWLEYKYGRSDEWVDSIISTYRNRIYLLCTPDMEWTEDDLRENPGDRDEIFEIYKENLEYYNLEYHILEGPKKLRLREAISIIESS